TQENPINWQFNEDGNIEGYITVDGQQVLAVTLELTSTVANQATVTLTLTEALENEIGGGANELQLGQIGVVATDSAGLTAEGTFIISSIDAVPVAGDFVDGSVATKA